MLSRRQRAIRKFDSVRRKAARLQPSAEYNNTICTVLGYWGRILAKRTNFGIPNEINVVRVPRPPYARGRRRTEPGLRYFGVTVPAATTGRVAASAMAAASSLAKHA